MASDPSAPKPSLHQRILGAIGPFPFFLLSAIAVGYHTVRRHSLMDEIINDFDKRVNLKAQPRRFKRFHRLAHSPGSGLVLGVSVAVVPWLFPGAWYAQKCQIKRRAWKAAEAQTVISSTVVGPNAAPGQLDATTVSAPSCAAPGWSSTAKAEAQHSFPLPSGSFTDSSRPKSTTGDVDESGYPRFQRFCAEYGLPAWLMAVGIRSEFRYHSVDYRTRYRKLAPRPRFPLRFAAYLSRFVTYSPLLVYIWYCRKRVTERDAIKQQKPLPGLRGYQEAREGNGSDDSEQSARRWESI